MRMPSMFASAALYRTSSHYRMAGSFDRAIGVIPQDCPWYKRAGCVLGPFSWCALASLGGAVPFWYCVDKARGGRCLDCIGTADPRDKMGEPGGGIICDSQGHCAPSSVGSEAPG